MTEFDHNDLSAWLNWIYSLHGREIDYTLERVRTVAEQLELNQQPSYIITVSGTNGKGSTVKILESIYLAANFKVGAYTSPSLFAYNERIRLNGKAVSDKVIINAFKEIEQIRNDIRLTPFEYTTLAALLIMKRAELDLAILEVGLGGRLDAVNIVDPDLAIITTVGLDHCDLLGSSREQIAKEKSGIFRVGKTAICGDPAPPKVLDSTAKQLSCPFYYLGQDFNYHIKDDFKNNAYWTFSNSQIKLEKLPIPKLAIQNAATALMAIYCSQELFHTPIQAIKKGLTAANLPGHFQIVDGDITHILDVGHNPHASKYLASCIARRPQSGKILAVFSMLADKDIKGTVAHLVPYIDAWFIAPMDITFGRFKRNATIDLLEEAIKENHINDYHKCPSIESAYQQAKSCARKGDTILIFGSHFILPVLWSKIKSKAD